VFLTDSRVVANEVTKKGSANSLNYPVLKEYCIKFVVSHFNRLTDCNPK
jgi:hypothetical protein